MSRQKIRVLHLIPTLHIGGAELDLVRKSLVLASSGNFEIYILPFQGIGPLCEFIDSTEGIKVFFPQRKGSLGMVTAAFKLRELVEEIKSHILHLHMFRSEIAGCLASIFKKRPIIVYTVQHMPNDEPYWKRAITWLASRNKDRLIASSQAVKDSLVKYVRLPQEKVEVIYNSVDFSRFDGLSHSPAAPDQPIIGTITRLHPDKGIKYLIEAFPKIIKEFPNAHGWIIGDGEEKPKLEALASRLGIQNRIKFWGWVREPFHLLAQMNIFVFPSITEALGIALIEAIGLGIPAVASKVGGVPEVLDGKPDWLVASCQPDTLADKILELLNNYPQAKDDATRLSHAVRKKFDVYELAIKQGELYRRVVERRS